MPNVSRPCYGQEGMEGERIGPGGLKVGVVNVRFGGFNKEQLDMFLVHLWCSAAVACICPNCDTFIVW